MATHYQKKKTFGVILGPTGSGKTTLVREICNDYTSGVLYMELSDSESFNRVLAKTIGMDLEPTSWFDVISVLLCYTIGFKDYIGYFELPKNEGEATTFILNALEERAIIFREKHHFVPVIFIDGIDVLAKFNEEAFVKLVTRAKYHANTGTIQIVFVSSEGHIMPLLQDTCTSSFSRADETLEILDITHEEASKYLEENEGMPRELAERVVSNITGGRMIYLVTTASVYRKKKTSENQHFTNIYNFVYARNIEPALICLVESGPIGREIINTVISEETANRLELLEKSEDPAKMKNTIAKVVNCNILRYTCTGKLAWHSHMIKEAVIKHYT